MKLEVLIALGILLVAAAIATASVALVARNLLRRSALTRKQIEEEFSWLFEREFRFTGSTALLAPRVSGRLKNGTNVTVHFRVPGRGYTGRMGYDGIALWLLQLSHFPAAKQAEIANALTAVPGEIIYQSESRIQWQPADGTAEKGSAVLERLFENLNPVNGMQRRREAP